MSEGLFLAGRYRLTEKLGAGGMGSVWRAQDQTLSAEVAIKLLEPQFLESPMALTRFRREAQAAASIRSTYVVQILDYGVDKEIPFIAMELLKGESLARRLVREGRLAPALAARLLTHVARALALAHTHGIVHRDMKPDNVFLVCDEDEEIAKVLDFGVARQAGGLTDSDGLKTRTGAIMGTPYYMSPEQATGQVVDHLTDIWSFGVIACECLTGQRAFKGDSLGGLFRAICMTPMPVPSQLDAVPEGFDAWFARAVARDQDQRFQTIKQAAEELRVICGHTATHRLIVANPTSDEADTVVSTEPNMLSLAGISAESRTTDPSSHSVSPVIRRASANAKVLGWVVAALIIGVAFASWRWLSRPNVNEATSAVDAAQMLSVPGAPNAMVEASAAQAVAASAPKTHVELSTATASAVRSTVALPPRIQASANANRAAAKPASGTPPMSKPKQQSSRGVDDNAAGI